MNTPIFYKEIESPHTQALVQDVLSMIEQNKININQNLYSWMDTPSTIRSLTNLKPFLDSIEGNDLYDYYNNIFKIGLVTLTPFEKIYVHIDATPPMFNLNIPVIGTEGSVTTFYRGALIPSNYTPGKDVNGILGRDSEVLEKYTLRKPTWHSAKILHGVVNQESNRCILSIKFKKDPLSLFYK